MAEGSLRASQGSNGIRFLIPLPSWLAGLPLNEAFLNQSLRFYNSRPQELSGNKTQDLQLINKWVRDVTKNKIKRLLKELEPDVQLVLLNAVYFQCKGGGHCTVPCPGPAPLPPYIPSRNSGPLDASPLPPQYPSLQGHAPSATPDRPTPAILAPTETCPLRYPSPQGAHLELPATRDSYRLLIPSSPLPSRDSSGIPLVACTEGAPRLHLPVLLPTSQMEDDL